MKDTNDTVNFNIRISGIGDSWASFIMTLLTILVVKQLGGEIGGGYEKAEKGADDEQKDA
jgi:hypothetical protein